MPDLMQEIGGLQRDLIRISSQVKNYAKETNDNYDDLRRHYGGIDARILDVEQKLARRGVPDSHYAAAGGRQTLGAAITEHDAFKKFIADGKRGRVALTVPGSTMTALITTDIGSGGSLMPPDVRVGPDDIDHAAAPAHDGPSAAGARPDQRQ